MAMLDKPNRSTWQLLSASSTLRHDNGLTQHAAHRLAAAVAFQHAVLGQRPPQRPERTACMHDAELHLHAHACTTRSSTCMHLHACMHNAELHLHAHACMHDAELHGHLGLLMHAQLALAISSPRGTSLRGVKDVGVKWMPGCGRRARVGIASGQRSTRARGRSKQRRGEHLHASGIRDRRALVDGADGCGQLRLPRAMLRAPKMTPWR
jgi:hypothetical protein